MEGKAPVSNDKDSNIPFIWNITDMRVQRKCTLFDSFLAMHRIYGCNNE